MSVAAWKDGVMAVDSRAYGGAHQFSPGTKNKLHRLDDGSLVGLISSTPGGAEYVLEWIKKGMPQQEDGGRPAAWADFILVRPNRQVFIACCGKRDDPLFVSGPIKSRMHAMGSGGELALGAMHAGLSAEEAVRIACKIDPHCGLPVLSMRL